MDKLIWEGHSLVQKLQTLTGRRSEAVVLKGGSYSKLLSGSGVQRWGLTLWLNAAFDLNAKHRKHCQPFSSLHIPIFIILFHFLFSLCAVERAWELSPQWRDLWSGGTASSAVLHSSFLSLSLLLSWGMEGSEGHWLSGWIFLKSSLPHILLFALS